MQGVDFVLREGVSKVRRQAPFDLPIQRTLNKASKTFLQLGLLVMLLTWLFIGC